jgi:hypothetical protein
MPVGGIDARSQWRQNIFAPNPCLLITTNVDKVHRVNEDRCNAPRRADRSCAA